MPYHIRMHHAVKVEVDDWFNNNESHYFNFCNWLAGLRVEYSHLQGSTLYVSSIITSIMQLGNW